MVVGIMVIPLVFNTKKVIILLDATSFFGFNPCNDFIAFNPNGVAAFPSPNILATILEEIYCIDSWFFGISGNKKRKKGDKNLENLSNNINFFNTDNFNTDTYVTYYVYIVKEDDTLNSIMEKFNVSKEKLGIYNDLSDLKKGTKIIIPMENE